jgi:hypothetical protein
MVSFPMYQFFVISIVFELSFPSKKDMIGNDNAYFRSFPTDLIPSASHSHIKPRGVILGLGATELRPYALCQDLGATIHTTVHKVWYRTYTSKKLWQPR